MVEIFLFLYVKHYNLLVQLSYPMISELTKRKLRHLRVSIWSESGVISIDYRMRKEKRCFPHSKLICQHWIDFFDSKIDLFGDTFVFVTLDTSSFVSSNIFPFCCYCCCCCWKDVSRWNSKDFCFLQLLLWQISKWNSTFRDLSFLKILH